MPADNHAESGAAESALTVEQFCERFGLSNSTFYKMQREGYAPATIKVGRRTLISRRAVTAWRERMELRNAAPANGRERFLTSSEHALACYRADAAAVALMRVEIRETLGPDALHAFGVGEAADAYVGAIGLAIAHMERSLEEYRTGGALTLDLVEALKLGERIETAQARYQACLAQLVGLAAVTGGTRQ